MIADAADVLTVTSSQTPASVLKRLLVESNIRMAARVKRETKMQRSKEKTVDFTQAAMALVLRSWITLGC